MNFQTNRELLARTAPRYREASRKKKTVILNEFIASTGYKRKYAIRLLCMREIPSVKTIKRPRARYYGKEVEEALIVTGTYAFILTASYVKVLAFYSLLHLL